MATTNTDIVTHNNNQYVLELRDTDRLLGRGASGVNFPGNRFFRSQIELYLDLYTQASTHTGRNTAVKMVMDAVHKHGGRFLVKVNMDEAAALGYPEGQEVYRIISDDFAINTVKQAFRDAINKPQANKLRDRQRLASINENESKSVKEPNLSNDSLRTKSTAAPSTTFVMPEPKPERDILLNQILFDSSEQELRRQLAVRNALLQELALRQYQDMLTKALLSQQTLQARLSDVARPSTPTTSNATLPMNTYVAMPLPVIHYERLDDAASVVSNDKSSQHSDSAEDNSNKRKHISKGQQGPLSKLPRTKA